jgi:hypothetical protein
VVLAAGEVGEGEVLEEGAPQEVASGGAAAEAGDTNRIDFILDIFQCPMPLSASHPLKGICTFFGVIKGAAFRTSNPGIFRRSCTPEEKKR